MESNFKSASIARAGVAGLGAGILLLMLMGCENSPDDHAFYQPPHVFGSTEVPDQILNEPRVVTTPTPDAIEALTWPRLGDVPSKPTNFTALPMIDRMMTEMETDRVESRLLQQQNQEALGGPPALVPPRLAQPY